MPLPKITPKTKKQVIYADFKKDLQISPLSKDLTLLKNEDAINDSLRNLLLTDKGERLMQPNLGSNIRRSLFDLMTPASLKVLEEQVKETINNHEPRVTLIDVTIVGLFDQNTVQITVKYYTVNKQEPVSVDIFLERTR